MRRFLLAILVLAVSAMAAESSAAQSLATVNGEPIVESELGIEGELVSLAQQAYQLRLRALEAKIADKLIANEAAKRGVTVQALLDEEINSKLGEPSEAEVEAFYQQQKTRIRRPLEEVRDQVVSFLADSRYRGAREAFVLKLRADSEVRILLDPPRLEVDLSQAPMRGPSDAPITIVEYSDFQCPFCRRVQPTLSAVQKKYGDKVRWSFKDLPLVSIHPAAQKAAQAARCAGDQGKFWEYREALFNNTEISDDLHDRLSSDLELSDAPFEQCLQSGKYKTQVDADAAEAQSFGISGTPAFIINGILLSGAQPFDEFQKVIDRELALAEND